MSKTLEDKHNFVELRAKGYSFSKIADETGVSKPTLIQWSQDEAVSRDIHNLRTLHMDELQEKYAMTKRHRIAVFGEVLNRAKTELESRDLADLPTDKLINLVVKLSDTLRQDETELVLMGEPEMMPVIDFMQPKSWYV
jgi:transcriptional regulator with XRE-family HTH domain